MKTEIQPLHDRVVVLRCPEEEITRGGLIIPDNAKEKPARGRVVAVGSGRRNEKGERIPLDVGEGDEILFGKFSGSELKLDDQELIVLREDEILAVLGEG